jgi:hypothetical protein
MRVDLYETLFFFFLVDFLLTKITKINIIYYPKFRPFHLQANVEKQRLEQKQRAARQAAEDGEALEPRWFEKVPGARPGEIPTYRYKGGYFEARAAGNYEGCRDIFSYDESSAPVEQ